MKKAFVTAVIALLAAAQTAFGAGKVEVTEGGAMRVAGVVTDNGDGSFRLGMKADGPRVYQETGGFELTVTLDAEGSLGGQLPINALTAGRGAYRAADFGMNYDGVPSYAGNAPEIVTFSDSPLASMFFHHASTADFSGKTVTLTYQGGTALFDGPEGVITVCGVLGGFTVTRVVWITDPGLPGRNAGETEKWERVATRVYPDVPTVENGSGYNYVDIEVPEGDGPYPVILWIHGGGWTQLDRKAVFIGTTMDYLLAKGFAVVSAEYTLSEMTGDPLAGGSITGGYPQMIYDVKAAVRFVRANAERYNLDTSFVAAMGESAGAHLAMLLGTTNGRPEYEDLTMGNRDYSSEVQAIISYFGPSDVRGWLGGYYVLGTDAYTDEAAEAASPYYQITAASPPLYVTHGRNDQAVPFENSVKIAAKARELIGAENVTEVFYDQAAHAEVGVYDSMPAIQAVYGFLKTQRERNH